MCYPEYNKRESRTRHDILLRDRLEGCEGANDVQVHVRCMCAIQHLHINQLDILWNT